ncbi:MAG: DAK2 domain-containing protein [Oscillospiraceae bacterium]|nr:DAK2 domain-containing protein [Oscillospiraceae bacterium]
MRDYIDAAAFKEMILCANAALHRNIQSINELNVFPVPDGDTGTNMGLTMDNAAAELRKRDFDTVAETANCVSSALLRGARGNSGVILSLLFRGIAKRLKGLETAGSYEFSAAMVDGVEAAYKAVMKPAEGTILTVSRLASAAAKEAAKQEKSLEEALVCAVKAGEEALEDTVNQNPVLKKAGVIDAGGKGYMVILHAILASLRGEISAAESEETAASAPEEEGVFEADKVDVPEVNVFDTVYIVRKDDPAVDLLPLRLYLDSIGDSLVISEDDEIFKVHVHTDIPGQALTESQKYGTLELAKIENMRTQALDMLAGRKAQSTDDLEAVDRELDKLAEQQKAEEAGIAAPEKQYGVVTVCAGAGMEALFRDMGADRIVTGGQTMNPSTEDILRQINRTPASTVFVFPNNKNITMAAQQCIPLTDKKVIVLPTRTVPQGVAALLSLNIDEPEAQIVSDMNEAISRVHTAMITYAARDSEFDGHDIRAGEYLALLDGALIKNCAGTDELFASLGESVAPMNPEFITVYYGADVTEDEAQAASAVLAGRFPEAELTVVSGGQPVYYYMIAVE